MKIKLTSPKLHIKLLRLFYYLSLFCITTSTAFYFWAVSGVAVTEVLNATDWSLKLFIPLFLLLSYKDWFFSQERFPRTLSKSERMLFAAFFSWGLFHVIGIITVLNFLEWKSERSLLVVSLLFPSIWVGFSFMYYVQMRALMRAHQPHQTELIQKVTK